VRILQAIKKINPSIINMGLVTNDGLTVAMLLPASDEGIGSLRTAVLTSIGERIMKTLSMGRLTEIVISTIDYVYLVMPVADDLYIGVLLDSKQVQIEKIRAELPTLKNLWTSYSDE